MIGMDYTALRQVGDDLHLLGIKHFDLDETLDCGQAFRYEKVENGYEGIAYGRRVSLVYEDAEQEQSQLRIKNTNIDDFNTLWRDHFDLGRSYTELRSFLVEHGGEPMRLATEYSPGLRHMKQEPWEILISFILSQNTNIHRIKLMLRRLCEKFGEKLPCGGSSFPTCERLASLNAEEMDSVKCGYRVPYVLDAARRVSSGKLNLSNLYNEETQKIREELQKIHGVGPKVADCVLLLGFGRVEVCPKDVWIKRALEKYYPKGLPNKLAPYAGIAQQFLFHFVRNT